MSAVQLVDFFPPPRTDAPWTRATVEESTDNGQTWHALVVNVALDPLDADPAHPQARGFSFLAADPPGLYRVTFFDDWGGSATTPPVSAPHVDVEADFTLLRWLRGLLDDVPAWVTERFTGDGVTKEFTLSRVPVTDTIAWVDGGEVVEDADYERAHKTMMFFAPPPDGKQVMVTYQASTFSDAELNFYLSQAAKQYVEDRHKVYRAAVYAIESSLVSAAQTPSFGAGQEQVDMQGVFSRLSDLRSLFLQWITDDDEATPAFELVDVIFDSIDPGFPGGFEPNDVISYPITIGPS